MDLVSIHGRLLTEKFFVSVSSLAGLSEFSGASFEDQTTLVPANNDWAMRVFAWLNILTRARIRRSLHASSSLCIVTIVPGATSSNHSTSELVNRMR